MALEGLLPPLTTGEEVVVPAGTRKPLVVEGEEDNGVRVEGEVVVMLAPMTPPPAPPPTMAWLLLLLLLLLARLLALEGRDSVFTLMVPVQADPVGQQPTLPAPSVEQIALAVQQAPAPLGSAEQGR
jgi:hypothetical protein